MDHHFLVRYSFTGVVLLLFALGGLWITNEAAATAVVGHFSGSNVQGGTALISAVATFPILGVMVHGLCLICIYRRQGHSFPDRARKLIADSLREKLSGSTFEPKFKTDKLNLLEMQGYFKKEPDSTRWYSFLFHDSINALKNNQRPNSVPDDSLFVWLYYFDAPVHMIEWARRRRDYYYLGVSWSLAALIGLIFGMIIGGVVAGYSEEITLEWARGGKWLGIIALFIFWSIWVVCAFWLGIQMKHDVDSMELIWACARLESTFKSHFLPGLAGDLQEGLHNVSTSLKEGLANVSQSLRGLNNPANVGASNAVAAIAEKNKGHPQPAPPAEKATGEVPETPSIS
jgi:hypothetical protein